MMQHNDDAKTRQKKADTYVKLFNGEKEVTMKRGLFLTDKSKEILRKGTDGQGFIYFVNLDTGEIHLLAANNPAKQEKITEPDKVESQQNDPRSLLEEDNRKNLHEREKISLKLGTLYDQKEANANESPELNIKIKELEDRLNVLENEYQDIQTKLQAIPAKKISATTSQLKESTIPLDRDGNPYQPGEYAITRREKTSESGGSGSGDLHAYGEHVLKLGPDKNILAGGFWIKREGEQLTFSDFRTRSTANTRLVKYNPLYRFLFNEAIKAGHQVGHTQVYVREIPKVYLEPVLDVFLQESLDIYKKTGQRNIDDFTDQMKESLSLSPDPDVETVIPESTRVHLELENQWQKSSNELLSNTLNLMSKKDKSNAEIRDLVKSFFDDNFVENRQLLPTLLTFIETHPSDPLSKQIIHCLHEQLCEIAPEALQTDGMDKQIRRFGEYLMMRDSHENSSDYENHAQTEFKQVAGELQTVESEKVKSLLTFFKNYYNTQADNFYKAGYHIDNVRKARENYEIALIFDPNDKHAKKGLGNVQVSENDLLSSSSAAAETEYAIALRQTTSESNRNNLLRSALKNYALALTIAPKNVKALNGHGKASCLLNDFDTAIKNHLSALAFEIEKTNPNPNQKKGLTAYNNLESHKNLVDTYNQQGSFCQQKKDFTKAAESYRSALELDPNNKEAYEGLKKTTQRGFVQRIGLLLSHKPAKNDIKQAHTNVQPKGRQFR